LKTCQEKFKDRQRKPIQHSKKIHIILDFISNEFILHALYIQCVSPKIIERWEFCRPTKSSGFGSVLILNMIKFLINNVPANNSINTGGTPMRYAADYAGCSTEIDEGINVAKLKSLVGEFQTLYFAGKK